MNNIVDINKAKKIIDKIDKKEKISYKDALTLLSSFEYDNNLNKITGMSEQIEQLESVCGAGVKNIS